MASLDREREKSARKEERLEKNAKGARDKEVLKTALYLG